MTKFAIALVCLFCLMSVVSKARELTIPKGSTSLSYLSHGEITSQLNHWPKCPPEAMCSPYTVVRIKFTLKGCLDEIGPISSFLTAGSTLIVAAVNIHHQDSPKVRCAKPRTSFKELVIPMIGQKVRLRMMK